MSRFLATYARCVKMAEAQGSEPFSLWPLTDEAYRMWKANSGNAKARRRWRRRSVPNTQRDTLTTCGNGHTMWRAWKPGDRCPRCAP